MQRKSDSAGTIAVIEPLVSLQPDQAGKRRRAQLQAITNLVRSEQIKDDLLANVTHELRTPLYGINGLAEAALAEFRSDNQNIGLVTQNLELIQASGDRLTKLVNDLLDFSAAREGATYVKFKPVDLNTLVTLVIAICKTLIGDKIWICAQRLIQICRWSQEMKIDCGKSLSTSLPMPSNLPTMAR
ncbi:MAG: hypothetical protein EXR84_05540 [Gammaproteobacteria bacterium]|nr:hypothetical protein [Gammaproteobacteria bacterium]